MINVSIIRVVDAATKAKDWIIDNLTRAFVILQLETSQHFLSLSKESILLSYEMYAKFYSSIFLSGFSIRQNYGPQYTLWITGMPPKNIHIALEKMLVHDIYSFQEFISVTFNFKLETVWNTEKANIFLMSCYNRYYAIPKEKWLTIICNFEEEFDCFHRIDAIITTASLLNNYFWNRGLIMENELLNQLHKSRGIQADARITASLCETFGEFVAYLINSNLPQNMSKR